MSGKTLYDKIWDAHLVKEREDGTNLIYIDKDGSFGTLIAISSLLRKRSTLH